MKEIQSFLDSKFRDHKTEKLGNIIDQIKSCHTIPKGTLVIMASGNAELRLKILDKDTPNKGFSTPLLINETGKTLEITPNYLIWYLSHEPIKEYLIQHVAGATLMRVPRDIIYNIKVPIPRYQDIPKNSSEEVVIQQNISFKSLINEFYEDYKLNHNNKRFKTCIILAGAICEVYLYQVLLDQGVEKKILDNDRSLGLDKMLTYLKILKIDKDTDIPLNHFEEIKKNRNKAIHAGLSVKDNPVFHAEDLVAFNQIIKFFGI
jgi:hypothetical protein